MPTPLTKSYQQLYHAPRQQLRLLPPGMAIETDKIMFDNDKLALISYGQTVHGVVIESEALTKTEQLVFEQIWALATER